MRSSVFSWVLCRAWPATLAGLLTLGVLVQAQAQSMGPDVKGGADHPLVSRFAGSQMVGYQQLEFDAGRFFLPNKASGYDPAKELDMEKPVVTEGKVTRLIYVAPAGKTALEVHRNFEQALKAAVEPGPTLARQFRRCGFSEPVCLGHFAV
ncbi:MAG: DUF4892 domain-containing protein [Hydrogenophaga sp.]|nr:DUF4892 domain-containing protein [Hydrogenophaga sp.]